MKFATPLFRVVTLLVVGTLCVQRPALSVKAAADVQVKHVYVVASRTTLPSIIGNKNMPG
jgi:hypothetical protein